MTPTQDQNQQTPNRDQKNTPIKEFPELDPSEPQQPEENPPPMMAQENPRKGGTTGNTNVNNQPDRENTGRSGNQSNQETGRNQGSGQQTNRPTGNNQQKQ